MYLLMQPLLFALEPERAHHFTLKSLKVLHNLGLNPFSKRPIDAPVKVMGLQFKNPIGLAAGLDKNAEYIDALGSLGFGFMEIGSVTPKPQPGNAKPRLFRLPKQKALINRMGFNSKGLDYFVHQLKQKKYEGILGVSITANTATPLEKTINDYVTCLRGVYPYADYVSLDVSCPNVKGKEALQFGDLFASLLEALQAERDLLVRKNNKWVPFAVKVNPDLTETQLAEITTLLLKYKIEGIIATNTTRSRAGLESMAIAKEQGGLSGAPLFAKSLSVVKYLKSLLGEEIPIIAVGGIMSGEDASQMFAAGASLIQIYTGLIYEGPGLIQEIGKTLTR